MRALTLPLKQEQMVCQGKLSLGLLYKPQTPMCRLSFNSSFQHRARHCLVAGEADGNHNPRLLYSPLVPVIGTSELEVEKIYQSGRGGKDDLAVQAQDGKLEDA